MKKFVAAILGAMLVFCSGNPSVFAEIVEADGQYIMGDGTEENQGVAKERARKDALRNASESVCVLVESFSEMIKGNLTRDEIRTVSANVLQVISASTKPVVVGETIKYVCHIIVSVEKENVLNYIQSNSKAQIDNSTRRIKELEAENARVNAELAELKQRYQNASQSERVEINTAIKRNEKQFTALQYTEQGATFYDKREYNKAIEVLNKALEINPEYSNAWSWLGAVYNDLGDTGKAIECNNKAIEIDPKNALAWNNLGVSYSHIGDFDKSVEYYKKATQLDPNLMYSWGNLARAYTDAGNFSKAIEYAEKAISLNPKHAYPWIALGETWKFKGDNEKALECFRKAVKLDPKNQLARTFLGDAYLAVNNQIKAAECFNQAGDLLRRQLETYPEDAMAWINLGTVYLSLQNYEDAIKCFQKAVELNPNFASAWAQLGFAYYNIKDFNSSLNAFNKAVELAPNNQQIKQARDAVATWLN